MKLIQARALVGMLMLLVLLGTRYSAPKAGRSATQEAHPESAFTRGCLSRDYAACVRACSTFTAASNSSGRHCSGATSATSARNACHVRHDCVLIN